MASALLGGLLYERSLAMMLTASAGLIGDPLFGMTVGGTCSSGDSRSLEQLTQQVSRDELVRYAHWAEERHRRKQYVALEAGAGRGSEARRSEHLARSGCGADAGADVAVADPDAARRSRAPSTRRR